MCVYMNIYYYNMYTYTYTHVWIYINICMYILRSQRTHAPRILYCSRKEIEEWIIWWQHIFKSLIPILIFLNIYSHFQGYRCLTGVCTCRGQRLTSGVLLKHSTLFFEIGSLTESSAHKFNQWIPAVCRSLSLQHWDYGMHWHAQVYVNTGDLNSDTQASVASTWPSPISISISISYTSRILNSKSKISKVSSAQGSGWHSNFTY